MQAASVLIAVVAVLGGCAAPGDGGAARAAGGSASGPPPAPETIFAIPGRGLVAPIPAPAGGAGADGVVVELSQGPAPAARAARVRAWAAPGPTPWTGPAYAWREDAPAGGDLAEPVDEPVVDAWIAVIDPPTRAAGEFILAGEPVRTVWLEPGPGLGWVAPADVEADGTALDVLLTGLAPMADDPESRWRYELLARRLGAAPAGAETVTGGGDAVEAMGEFRRDLWAAALGRLRGDSEPIAVEVVERLTTLLRLPDGRLLPGWAADRAGAEALLTTLLEAATPRERRLHATAWLDGLPEAAVWIAADWVATPEGPVARVGVAELAGRQRTASAAREGRFARNVMTLPAHHIVYLDVPLGPAEGASSAEGIREDLVVRLGRDSRTAAAVVRPAPIEPPGLRMVGFYEPWVLSAWRAGTPIVATDELVTAAMLFFDDDAGRWRIHAECRSASAAVEDSLTFFLGGSAAGAAVRRLTVSWDGSVTLDGEARDDLLLRRGGGGGAWTALIEAPLDSTSGAGVVTIAAERRWSGRRATWPRPVTPFDEWPAGLPVDLNAWVGGRPQSAESATRTGDSSASVSALHSGT